MRYAIITISGALVAGVWPDGSVKYVGEHDVTAPLLFDEPSEAFGWFVRTFPALPPAEHRSARVGDTAGTHMIVEPTREAATYSPADRAREKQAAREQDAADLASGARTREQLHAENAAFAGLRVRVNFAVAKRIG